ncbi:DNA-3-methyladenine glycosylase-like [Ptychodera flava]|uniref:DNA-3-methyladenine glycosylase-like n=1 Tax=Ptychodera flava TaxID=63121 RepID=UPI003969DD3F
MKKSATKRKGKGKGASNSESGDLTLSKKLKLISEKRTLSSTGKECARMPKEFFEKPCVDLAKALLGKILVRKPDSGDRIAGKIVEVEAYLGGEDKGAHSYGGKKTPKNAAMFMAPATVYVYWIYGSYSCINISSQGDGAAVLIRAIEPVDGKDRMHTARSAKRKEGAKPLKDHELGNGPSKLCQAMMIDKPTFNEKDLTDCKTLWLENGDSVDKEIVSCSRIGIDYAEEWASKPLRFYIKGNKCVSVRDKKAEENES